MSLEVKILGSNAAAPAHHRNQSAQIVRLQNQTFLVDCGEAAQIQAKKYGVRINKINHIFISHLHGDHYYGLMGLISTMHLYGRQADLHIYGPKGLNDIITLQLRYSDTRFNFNLEFTEWATGESGILYEDHTLTVTSIPLDHRIACAGFLFREKPKRRRINPDMLKEEVPPMYINRLKNGQDVLADDGTVKFKNTDYTLPPKVSYSYAYCSDTRYNERILEWISGIDLLYHESTFTEEFKDRAYETYHTTARQAGLIAKKAGVKKLILGHFSNRYKDLSPILKEAREEFPESCLGYEGESFLVDY